MGFGPGPMALAHESPWAQSAARQLSGPPSAPEGPRPGPWARGPNLDNFNKNISIELNETDDHITLVIDDTGIGFKNLDTNIKDILNPYFTTKQKGTGLGLSIVNKIINDHNGNIDFLSKNDGAKIKIIFIK